MQEIERAAGVSGEGPDEDLQSSADEPVRQVLLGGVAAVRSWRAYLKGEPHDAIALARRALALLPEKDLELRTFAAFAWLRPIEPPTTSRQRARPSPRPLNSAGPQATITWCSGP